MSNLTRDPKTNKITRFRLESVRVQYPALTEPRGDDDLKPGTYGAQLLIEDPATVALMKEYATEVAKEAAKTVWKKVPSKITVPYNMGDEEREAEEGKMILKTNSSFQPKLYIRRPGKKTIVLDDNEEFYAGMYVDADVVFKAYNVTGNYGVTAYLQAVCKVADGEPFYASSAASFDIEDFEEDEASTFDVPTPTKTELKKAAIKKSTTKEVVAKKPVIEVTDLSLDDFDLDEDDFSLDELAETSETSNISIEDLLK